MLSLILAESALEVVPERVRGHPAVASSSRRLGRSPASMLLDVSWHHAAMGHLAGARRRGRPDIVHFALLAAAGTPLYAAGRLGVYVHTVDDAVVRIGQGARLPKSYHRFAGLLGDILSAGDGAASAADGADGRPLLEARRPMSLAQLLGEIRPAVTVGMTRSGRPGTFRDAAARLASAEAEAAAPPRGPGGPCLIVGGFQRGGFSGSTLGALDRAVSVGPHRLEAHVVVSRALYEYEEAAGVREGGRPRAGLAPSPAPGRQ